MSKPKTVQMSNWENESLSDQQIMYAAYDALMGRQVSKNKSRTSYYPFNRRRRIPFFV
jgi:hypothetical protein